MASTAEEVMRELEALLEQLEQTPADTAAVATFLQVHASDLKSIVAAGDGSLLLDGALHANNADIVLALLDAGATENYADVYSCLLEVDYIYALNGDVLDDAGIARRLRVMRDVHRVKVPRSRYMSDGTSHCVRFDRLECLRIMLGVDIHAWGYSQYGHDSLLHVAAAEGKAHIVRFLLKRGWILEETGLNSVGLSPVGQCLLPLYYVRTRAAPGAVCDTLDALLQHVEHAATEVRISGLCGLPPVPGAARSSSRYHEHWYLKSAQFLMPTPQDACMIAYVCAAVRAHSILPRRLLGSYAGAAAVMTHSPTIMRTLPLDEHVHTGVGEPIYLHDSLRVASSFHSAARYTAVVDALCVVEEKVNEDRERWRHATCTRVLQQSGAAVITGASPTLRCWAWMRRVHAITQRR